MSTPDLVESLSTLDKIMSRMNCPDLDTFRLTTRIILSGLRKPQTDESVISDGLAHLEQARRLLGGQP